MVRIAHRAVRHVPSVRPAAAAHLPNELLLACALAMLALSNLPFVTVPTVAGEAPTT